MHLHKDASVIDESLCFMRNTIALLHEQRQLEHIVCYEAAICYHVEWCKYEWRLLILRIFLENVKRARFPIWITAPHMLICTLS